MSELNRILGCEDEGRSGDVVFVHGLGGNAREYWHPKGEPGKFWPTWLGEDLSDLGIWSVGYDAAKFAWGGTTMPLIDRATNALALLDVEGIGERPVVFITHSMGGLLVKQMIQSGLASGDRRWKAIAQQTRGISFLSTPHIGSDLARWIEFLGKFLLPTVSVEELKAHDPQLRGLNTWYRNHSLDASIRTEAYCEKRKTHGVLVVDEDSANPGIPGVNPIPMDDDHITICRPASRDSLLYKRVKRFTRECLPANPR